ncbi:endonuclease/exonuclease/phosphatase family protein [Bogoriella caseilytica]|uniref:Endonuclease/exonuclease/phosphatase family protein n=1 Tax=Bogoriella caseilytica TaxID=56055 RepID=A0A3N2BCS6_9MICO|nr:endonuclease/exonuclease/phosphatase family protein [Bogoriella caseilytica]ROR73057.1 endonuclease/exonuclease/phosphatase family protein [Bogoriella caseilytica]
MRILGWVLAALVAVASVLTLNPEWIGVVISPWADLTVTYPVSQVIALRSLLVAVFLVLALVFFIAGLVRKIGYGGGTRTLVLTLVMLLVAVGHGSYTWSRGVTNPAEFAPDRDDDRITVFTMNTDGGDTGAESIAEIAGRAGADVLVLNETPAEVAEEAAVLMDQAEQSYQVFTPVIPEGEGADSNGDEGQNEEDEASDLQPGQDIAVLISSSLGEYVVVTPPGTHRVSLRVEPADGVGPAILGVHVTAPVAELHEEWLEDLATVMELCEPRGPRGLIIAGDFNATLDHRPLQDLQRCDDAAVEAGVGGIATWPANLPALIGAPIDRVLYDSQAYETVAGQVVESGRSDHRAVLVRLQPIG